MKNIHVLPTDKPSRLAILHNGNLHIGTNFKKDLNVNPQHIYITSDEEIKEGDWFSEKAGRQYPIQWDGKQKLNFHCKKIILTTDQDLIADGVQAITNTFAEWFVNNPSCEEVEVKDVFKSSPIGFGNAFDYYKIIIPKEEPKQEPCDNCGNEICCCILRKQETLEEAFNNYVNKKYHSPTEGSMPDLESAKFGAKWQQERMYSDEEVLELLQKALTHKDNGETGNLITAQGEIRTANFYSWFEQNKKK